MADEKAPVSAEDTRVRTVKDGHLAVAELVSERPAAPSPFGDDQTFPLPVDELNFVPPTAW